MDNYIIKLVDVLDNLEESKRYLEKKISEGKKYQQAIRSIGRHLVRVIWNMIQQDRAYEIR